MAERGTLVENLFGQLQEKHEGRTMRLSQIMTEGTYEGLGQENALPIASQLTFVRWIHIYRASLPRYPRPDTLSKESMI